MSSSNPAMLLLLVLALGCGAPETRGEPASSAAPAPGSSAAQPPAPGSATAQPSATQPAAPGAATARPAATQPAAAQAEHPIFAPILARLRGEVRVPLRLPGVLGWEDTPPDSAFALVQRADSAGYVLMIALASDCDGGNWCRYGSVSGMRLEGAEEIPEGTPVPLGGGVTGHFVDATCGAVCGDSRLWWVEGGVRYAVGVKGASAELLAPVARSALGQR